MNVHYTACPVCGSKQIIPCLFVKDQTVSKKDFAIWHCTSCTLRFTQDVPDETSIGAFYASENYISHTNTGKGLVNKLYKKVRNITLAQKVNLVRKTTGKNQGRLLDIGCGIGAFLHSMHQKRWEVSGIEPDAKARAMAKDLFQLEPFTPAQLFELPKGTFDAITMWHVLEHVHRLHEYIDQLKELLTQQGKLIIAVPNYTSTDAIKYGENWAAYDVPRHLYHFSPKAMEMLMQQHDLKLVAKRPMWFDSFYISMLSSQYEQGQINWLGSLSSGLRSNLKALADTDRCSSLIYILEKA